MASAQVLGYRPGIGSLLEAGFFEADDEGAQGLTAQTLKQGHSQGGINHSKEKGPQRHISDDLLGHGQIENLFQGIQCLRMAMKGNSAARLNHGTELQLELSARERQPRRPGKEIVTQWPSGSLEMPTSMD